MIKWITFRLTKTNGGGSGGIALGGRFSSA